MGLLKEITLLFKQWDFVFCMHYGHSYINQKRESRPYISWFVPGNDGLPTSPVICNDIWRCSLIEGDRPVLTHLPGCSKTLQSSRWSVTLFDERLLCLLELTWQPFVRGWLPAGSDIRELARFLYFFYGFCYLRRAATMEAGWLSEGLCLLLSVKFNANA